MLRLLILTLGMAITMPLIAQENLQEVIKSRVDLLFDAMRSNDSTRIVDLFVPGAELSSIYRDRKSGKTVRRTTLASDFVTAVGTPHAGVWDEQIWSYDIKVDGVMASVWTEYTFYLDYKRSHCGVNVFEFMNTDKGWQISGLTDTRRQENCISSAEYDVHALMTDWHAAAARGERETVLTALADDMIYIGTDARQRMTLPMIKSKWGNGNTPLWTYRLIGRDVTLSADKEMAFFDESLNTEVGPCTATGIARLTPDGWRIVRYHLSIALPEERREDYMKLLGKH